MGRSAFTKVLLVANPISGLRRAGRWREKVEAAFRRAGHPVETLLTRGPGHAAEAAADCPPGCLIVAFGGDGTFNEVLNGARLDSSTLAVIPAGTGNVFAKELGSARQPLKAARQLLQGHVVRLDVGLCNGRRFMSVFGAGIDAWVVERVHERRGGSLTQWHYLPHIARIALKSDPWRIRVEVDGQQLTSGAEQVCAGNTRSYGGPIAMTPAASPADGLLDVMCFARRGPADGAVLGACALLRALHLSTGARYARGRTVTVSAPGQRVPYELDGDSAGSLPARVSVLPGAARVLVPRAFRPRPPRGHRPGTHAAPAP